VWEITSSGTYKDLHDFGDTVIDTLGTVSMDGIRPYAGVTFDNAGIMYGTTQEGGANNGPGMVWALDVSALP
jgi:hypothetical protein